MSEYILYVFLFASSSFDAGTSISTESFKDEKSCIYAQKTINRMFPENTQEAVVKAVCLPKERK
jgi:hypothetical protein